MSKPFHILILSVGSLLGQNILDTLEGRRSRVRVTGINTNSENARVFRCDKVYKAPLTETADFNQFLLDIIEKEQPDLILPGRDYDVLTLSELVRIVPELQKRIPVGDAGAVRIMNDKGLSYNFSRVNNLPFAHSFIYEFGKTEQALSWARTCGFPLLFKPREGFGSLGIRILSDEAQLEALLSSNPEGFMLQEMLDVSDEHRQLIEGFREDVNKGVPLFFHMPDNNQFAGQTIIKPDGSIGEIFTSRSLMVLGRCERSERWDDPVFIDTVRAFAMAISSIGWRGTFNIQCRRTDKGYSGVEMNPRMSGSTSARGWLGYDEMREVILAFNNHDIGRDLRYPQESKGTVYRSLTDYYVADEAVLEFNTQGVYTTQRNYSNKNTKKRILITGSTGYCGQALINKLSLEDSFEINVLSRDPKLAQDHFGGKVAHYYKHEDFIQDLIPFGDMDILFHLGFARPHHGNVEISKSLQFTSELFLKAAANQIRAIINVSSRSVYGLETPSPWSEEAPKSPSSLYGQAKLASELLLTTLISCHPHTMGTSIRLGTVSGGSNGLIDVFTLTKFVKQALSGEPINIIGGTQEFDILDINDTVDAFIALLRTPTETWRAIYNLSSESTHNIVHMAQLSVEIASRYNNGIRSPIHIEEKEVNIKYGMDSSLFYHDMNWYPKIIKLDDIIESLIEYYTNQKTTTLFSVGGNHT